MTTDQPPPGSMWAKCCPDAYPAEWFNALGLTALPPGFTRFANTDEFALITGTAPPPADATSGRANETALPQSSAPTLAKPEGRFAVLNAFTDCALADLTGAETKVWLILFRDTKTATGTARTGQADLARRAGIEPRTVRRALTSLEAKGMVHVVRRGLLNAGPSVYRLHPTGPA